MALYTKSIQDTAVDSDGIRVCVMRRPDEKANFDIWMPTLSPSHLLLDEYHDEKIDWHGYVPRFEKEVIKGASEYIDILGEMAMHHTITILCWEKTPEKCHRRLLAEEVKRRFPRLEVVIN